MSCVERMLKLYGGVSAVGRVMRLSRQNVNSWKVRGYIPPKYAFEVERITKGQIKASEVMGEAVEKVGRAGLRSVPEKAE